MTDIYQRIALNTLILSSDIIDLRDLAFHEAARSEGEAEVLLVAGISNPEDVGKKALYDSVRIIYNNLTSMGYTLTSEE
jgi:N-acetylglutamate synthase-like GNAT family acetyltransferase